jgi:hypothetical protein
VTNNQKKLSAISGQQSAKTEIKYYYLSQRRRERGGRREDWDTDYHRFLGFKKRKPICVHL